MHWGTILSLSTCALLAAYLTFFQGWSGQVAVLLVPMIMLLLSGLVVGTIYVLSDAEQRAEILRDLLTQTREEIKALSRILTFRH